MCWLSYKLCIVFTHQPVPRPLTESEGAALVPLTPRPPQSCLCAPAWHTLFWERVGVCLPAWARESQVKSTHTGSSIDPLSPHQRIRSFISRWRSRSGQTRGTAGTPRAEPWRTAACRLFTLSAGFCWPGLTAPVCDAWRMYSEVFVCVFLSGLKV